MDSLFKHKKVLAAFKLGILVLPFLFFWLFNQHNIPVKFSLLLGIIAFPFVANPNSRSARMPLVTFAIITIALLIFTRSGTLFYFLAIWIAFLAFEWNFGKINLLPILLAIVISPAFSNIIYIWSFPIRIKLTSLAAATLQLAQMTIEVSGNVILLNGENYSVDPACVGLNMVVTTLVVALITMGFAERKHKVATPSWLGILCMGGVLLMSVFSNFIRILVLILFHIIPENPLHEVIGVMCMLLYVIAPFTLMSKWIYPKIQKNLGANTSQESSSFDTSTSSKKIKTILILLIMQIGVGWQFLTPLLPNKGLTNQINMIGYSKSVTPNGVVKLENSTSLIYIKPPVQFYQGSHDPRYCWQGSGYEFTQMQQVNIHNNDIYTAVLTKGEDKIYAAWWYQNQSTITPDEWDWRWKSMFRQSDFFMINVNCATRDQLNALIESGFAISL